MAEITAALIKDLRDKTDCGMMDAKRALTETGGNMDAAIELLRKQGTLKGGKVAGRNTTQGRVGIALSKDGKHCAVVAIECETDFTARNDKFIALTDTVAANFAEKGGDIGASPTVKDALTKLIATTGENMKLGKSQRLTLTGVGFFGTYLHSDFKLGVAVQIEGDDGKSDGAKLLGKDLAMHAAANNPIALDKTGVPADVIAKERSILAEAAKNDPKNAGKPANIIEKIAEGQIGAFLKDRCFVEQPFVKDPKVSVTQQVENVGKTIGKTLKVTAYTRIKVGE
ncbi:MAG: translation elongation factor Ts [Planctomycetes bacterium]|nr:translation elongation factor Ts [Planctomycetota bacterium]